MAGSGYTWEQKSCNMPISTHRAGPSAPSSSPRSHLSFKCVALSTVDSALSDLLLNTSVLRLSVFSSASLSAAPQRLLLLMASAQSARALSSTPPSHLVGRLPSAAVCSSSSATLRAPTPTAVVRLISIMAGCCLPPASATGRTCALFARFDSIVSAVAESGTRCEQARFRSPSSRATCKATTCRQGLTELRSSAIQAEGQYDHRLGSASTEYGEVHAEQLHSGRCCPRSSPPRPTVHRAVFTIDGHCTADSAPPTFSSSSTCPLLLSCISSAPSQTVPSLDRPCSLPSLRSPPSSAAPARALLHSLVRCFCRCHSLRPLCLVRTFRSRRAMTVSAARGLVPLYSINLRCSALLLAIALLIPPFVLPIDGDQFTRVASQSDTVNLDFSPREAALPFAWAGAISVAGRRQGNTQLSDVWGSYDFGRTWQQASTLPGPCASNSNRGLVYNNAVYLVCAGSRHYHGAPDATHEPTYVSRDSALATASWMTLSDGCQGCYKFNVERMAVPFDGVGTLVLINSDVYSNGQYVNYVYCSRPRASSRGQCRPVQS